MRLNLMFAAGALLGALSLASPALRAADVAATVPETAGAFAKYCTPLNAACEDKITVQQVAVMGDFLYGKGNGKAKPCVIPDDEKAAPGHESDAADKAIINWLSAHPETAAMPTFDGINAAAKSLYCQ